MLYVGLMSGTSMDGIEGAVLEVSPDGQCIKELHHTSKIYSTLTRILFKATEYAVRHECGDLIKTDDKFEILIKKYLTHELKIQNSSYVLKRFQTLLGPDALNYNAVRRLSTSLHSHCVKNLLGKAQLFSKDIVCIGYHGQTLYHNPAQRQTVLMADGALLAQLCACDVVTHFRENDISHGGQGAPFAPIYHFILAKTYHLFPVGFLNLGGIANITIVTDDNENNIMAFDTGPANGLLDRFVRLKTQGKQQFDLNGAYGAKGKICTKALDDLKNTALLVQGENYFMKPPPKALDSGHMMMPRSVEALTLEDGCATLMFFTCWSLVESLKWVPLVPMRWIVAGAVGQKI